MSVNENLFKKVYAECLSIIDASNDVNIQRKRKKYEAAYQSMLAVQDSEHKDFNSDVHELRTYQYLVEKGFSVSASDDNKAGPDFNVDGLGYVECVICTKGQAGNVAREFVDAQLGEVLNRYKAALPRITAAIKEKREKYATYLEKEILFCNTPRIIAVNTTIFSNIVHSDLMVRLVEQVLYGIGVEVIQYNKRNGQFKRVSSVGTHCYDDCGKKTSKTELKLDYFALDEYRDISAVILINNSIGEKLTDEYFSVFLNPRANVPISDDTLKSLNYFMRTGVSEQEEVYQWYRNGSRKSYKKNKAKK